MNILIVGLGSIARKHLKALKFLKIKANIFAFRSSEDATNELGVQNIYSLEKLNIKFYFAIISNPTHLHFNFIKKLAPLGIPLFIEKPLVNKFDSIESLRKLVKKNNLITYVACNLRFHPCIGFLKKSLCQERSKINEVNVYCGSYLPDWRPGKDYRKTYSANSNMGGGVHLDLFHELDYVSWLFGLPKRSQSFLRNVSSLDINSIDYANYILEYNNFTVSVILNYYRKTSKRKIEIIFEEKIWIVDLLNNNIKDDKGVIIFDKKNFNILNTYNLQLDYFINSLLKKTPIMNSIEESLGIHEICLRK